MKVIRDLGNVFAQLSQTAEGVARTVGQAAGQAAGDAAQGAEAAARGAGDTFERAAGQGAAWLGQLGAATVRAAGDVLEIPRQLLARDYEELVRQEIDRGLAEAPEGARRLAEGARERIVDNLMATMPRWSELEQLGAAAGAVLDRVEALGEAARPLLDGIGAIAGELFVGEAASKQADGRQFVVQPDGSVEEYDPEVHGDLPDAIRFTNGVYTRLEGAQGDAAALAAREGKPVLLTYNASDGFVSDVAQAGIDKLEGESPAVAFALGLAEGLGVASPDKATMALADEMVAAAKGDGEVDFVGYSQGGLITRNALLRAHTRLYTEKYAEELQRTGDPLAAHRAADRFAAERMQNVHVVTAGGAAWSWPPLRQRRSRHQRVGRHPRRSRDQQRAGRPARGRARDLRRRPAVAANRRPRRGRRHRLGPAGRVHRPRLPERLPRRGDGAGGLSRARGARPRAARGVELDAARVLRMPARSGGGRAPGEPGAAQRRIGAFAAPFEPPVPSGGASG